MQSKGYLVLGRYCGESIMIGDNIKVLISSVDNDGMVRIAVEAPKDVAVDRIEIWEKKMRGADVNK